MILSILFSIIYCSRIFCETLGLILVFHNSKNQFFILELKLFQKKRGDTITLATIVNDSSPSALKFNFPRFFKLIDLIAKATCKDP